MLFSGSKDKGHPESTKGRFLPRNDVAKRKWSKEPLTRVSSIDVVKDQKEVIMGQSAFKSKIITEETGKWTSKNIVTFKSLY